ncbi:MAG: septal ring lytic transglycosylase RlpA family protein [Gammaproteobacteria bacterium]|nr:septal ring lytic transglycosylase RlpA family protein [Gammaproteobacteria bacterium]
MPALEETPPEITPESVFSAHHEEELKTLTDQDKKIQQGMASWYGPGFEGKKTANGEIFSARRLTAAHHFLAFGAKIKVTNLENGLSVIVRINDRIPKTNKTVIIDLSKAAAKKIDMLAHGKVPVKLEYE